MRSPNRFASLVLAGAIGACAPDLPVAPDAPSPSLSVSTAGTDDRHVVLFKKESIPNGFEGWVGSVGGTVMHAWSKVGIAVVSGLDTDGLLGLQARSDVQAVVRDEALQLGLPTSPEVEGVPDEFILGEGVASPADPSLAFFYPRQWHMRQIQANLAWAAGKLGSPAVTLAILDTGIDYTYPDLAGRVDLSRSTSFVPSDDALVNAVFPGRHVVSDLHWHGSHVASTAVSNANLIAGVTSMVTLIGVKVCNVNGSCPTSGVLGGILYAADAGAHVANLSLGGTFSKAGANGFHALIGRVMHYAQQKGTLVVVASGNALPGQLPIDMDNNDDQYMAYCDAPNVACIAATGPTSGGTVGPWVNPDNWASYSNYGITAVNVAAPGGTGGGAVWAACSQTSLVIPVCRTGTFVLGAAGTSMATPHASAVAALLVERLGKNPQAIRSQLQDTSDDVQAPGPDAFSGKGRVNAARAAGVIQ